jgi:hypothetical protein
MALITELLTPSETLLGQWDFNQSINLLLNYLVRLCPLNPRLYGAQTNTSPLKTTAYGYLHTTKISLNSTSIINII